jgi:hypothetical protein
MYIPAKLPISSLEVGRVALRHNPVDEGITWYLGEQASK